MHQSCLSVSFFWCPTTIETFKLSVLFIFPFLIPCSLGMIGWPQWEWGTVTATVGEMVATEGGETAGKEIGTETGDGDRAEITGDQIIW